ncbi:MAG: glycosyltransferase family 4 protein [Nitrospiria bacterium]
MRILYICSDTGIPVRGGKGASVHVREFISALTRAGHSVVLAAQVLNKSPWERPANIEADVIHVEAEPQTIAVSKRFELFNQAIGATNILPKEIRKVLYNQDMHERLFRKFRKTPPDIIYERASLYGIAGALLSRDLNVPRLVELNAPLTEENTRYQNASGLGPLSEQSERWSLMEAEFVLPVSEALRKHVISKGLAPNRVVVVPNAVDESVFYPDRPDPFVRNAWKLGDGPVMGFVGGLRPWHGVEWLPELLEVLQKRFKNLQFMIVGEGPLREKLTSDFKRRDLTEKVIFTGSLPHESIAKLIRQFDIALAPYPRLDHTFYFSPLKLFEYMACGIPVVAADIGQITEVVRNDETGLLYPPGNFEALTKACSKLLSDPGLRERFGKAAPVRIQKTYTWSRNVERVIRLAEQSISKKREAHQ